MTVSSVYLIKASAPGPFKDYKKAMGAPPQNIFSVAAATPRGIDVAMCDETIGMKPRFKIAAEPARVCLSYPMVSAHSGSSVFRENTRRAMSSDSFGW